MGLISSNRHDGRVGYWSGFLDAVRQASRVTIPYSINNFQSAFRHRSRQRPTVEPEA
jgi:hypothetical protein